VLKRRHRILTLGKKIGEEEYHRELDELGRLGEYWT
jgi:hypothetical protein